MYTKEQRDAMGDYTQASFAGGMNMVLDETRLQENQYVYAFNVRNRFDVLSPITDSLEVESPSGLKQGLYAIGNILVVFVAGKAYYKEKHADAWTQVTGFQMSTTAKQFWCEVVPVSTANMERKATDSNGVTLNFGNTSTESPRALVVQDGVNQPWLIFPDATARKSKDYTGWTTTDREYLPIGKMMVYVDGILFIVSADGTKIFRSVTGRPLDCMVNILPSGDKQTTETIGGAASVSFAPSFDGITAISALNSGEILVANNKNTVLFVIDRSRTVFGEPTFTVKIGLPVGCVNQQSFIDILGDYAFMDFVGIRSFNAVQQLRFEGRNSAFSLPISPAFKDIIQDSEICCAISYDNYAMFAVNTIFGYATLVYDILNKTYVSFDLTSATKLKQFATTYPFERKLYAISEDKVWEIFASTDYPLAILRTKAFCSQDPKLELQCSMFRMVFTEPQVDGRTVRALLYVDGRRSAEIETTYRKKELGIKFPMDFPITFDSDRSCLNLPLNFQGAETTYGWKIGFIVKWKNGAKLTNIAMDGVVSEMKINPIRQRSLQ